jgi:hypothetical protein
MMTVLPGLKFLNNALRDLGLEDTPVERSMEH